MKEAQGRARGLPLTLLAPPYSVFAQAPAIVQGTALRMVTWLVTASLAVTGRRGHPVSSSTRGVCCSRRRPRAGVRLRRRAGRADINRRRHFGFDEHQP
jgi:hypothetical protein